MTTPLDGVPYTDTDPDDITAGLRAAASVAAVSAGRVIYTAGSFVPGTTGTFPNNYAHGGIAYDKASTEKAVMVLFCPAAWTSPVVSILALAENFQSGNVRFRFGSEGGSDDLTVTVTGGVFLGELDFPTGPSWSPASAASPAAGLQFVQFPLTRVGGDAADTLDDDLAVLSVFVTET